MEFITDHQMDNYQAILNETDEKFEELKQLQSDIQKYEKKLALCNLVGNENFHRLVNVTVKLFSDIAHLFSLYNDRISKDIYELCSYKYHNYCLIQVNISKAFGNILSSFDWYINVGVKRRSLTIANTTLKASNNTTTFFGVIPFNGDVDDCKICTTLLVNIQTSWIYFDFQNVDLNVCYQISTGQPTRGCRDEWGEFPLTYCLPYKVSVEEFVATFTKNCYCNVESGTFMQLINGLRNTIDFTISNCNSEHTVVYKDSKITFNSDVENLFWLKLYFSQLADRHVIKNDKTWIRNEIAKFKKVHVHNVEEAINFYKSVRDLWSKLLELRAKE